MKTSEAILAVQKQHLSNDGRLDSYEQTQLLLVALQNIEEALDRIEAVLKAHGAL